MFRLTVRDLHDALFDDVSRLKDDVEALSTEMVEAFKKDADEGKQTVKQYVKSAHFMRAQDLKTIATHLENFECLCENHRSPL